MPSLAEAVCCLRGPYSGQYRVCCTVRHNLRNMSGSLLSLFSGMYSSVAFDHGMLEGIKTLLNSKQLKNASIIALPGYFYIHSLNYDNLFISTFTFLSMRVFGKRLSKYLTFYQTLTCRSQT